MKNQSYIALVIAVAATTATAQHQTSAVDEAGTLHFANGEIIPYSNLSSSKARKNFIDTTRGYEALAKRPASWKPKPHETEAEQLRRWYNEGAYIPWLTKLRQHFPVVIESKMIASVQADVITPQEGISDRNKTRILINLHGGGMVAGARYGGQLESIPVSSMGKIRVITVDYRMAPENKYPAAEDDIIAVYGELLKTYRAENIGIYGCSAGASLTGSVVAKLIQSGQPKPGAIGMFGSGPFGQRGWGDSNYIFSGGMPIISAARENDPNGYHAGLNMDDLVKFPAESPEIQRQFPPALLISGTRDFALSRVVFAHALLRNLDVDAELYVWEGAPHCSFAQPFVDPQVPESQQAWSSIIKFFDKHLGANAH